MFNWMSYCNFFPGCVVFPVLLHYSVYVIFPSDHPSFIKYRVHKPGFDPRPVHVRTVMDKVTLIQGSIPVLTFRQSVLFS